MPDFKPFAGLAQESTIVTLFYKMFKFLEPLNMKDSAGRQRVVVDNTTTVTGTIVLGAGAANIGALTAGTAAIGSVNTDGWDRRQFQPMSRAAYNGLRANLKFGA